MQRLMEHTQFAPALRQAAGGEFYREWGFQDEVLSAVAGGDLLTADGCSALLSRAQRTPRSVSQLQVLYADNHCLAVAKPAKLLTAGDRTGDETLLEHCKAYVKQTYGKPGNVYLGLVHRLDRPTSGVVLFARTSKAAARLAQQFRRESGPRGEAA